ncbi:MAG: hypothetical protein ACM3VT_05965, partial [Solirubrobacterales bacterium]
MPKNGMASCGGHECPGHRAGRSWVRWVFPVTGLFALVWFLIRVIPKPSRATYPCQRAAMPMASAFVVWLIGLAASAGLSARFRRLVRDSRVVLAGICLVTILVAGVLSIAEIPDRSVQTASVADPHGPMGEAKGIHPGRVVWVYDPNATDWDGYESSEHWWQDEHTDPNVVEKMVSQAIRGVAGTDSDEAAWDAIFKYFNDRRGKGEVGYQPGEKIAIKINLTTCNASGGDVSPVTYDKKVSVTNRIDNSPQMTVALLRQLVYTVGADQNDITIGDPTGMVPNYWWDRVHPEFPNVHYLDNYGGSGRMRAEFSKTPLYWSTPAAKGKLQDYLPIPFAKASYIINFAILKGHSSGITLCAKNNYGSL